MCSYRSRVATSVGMTHWSEATSVGKILYFSQNKTATLYVAVSLAPGLGFEPRYAAPEAAVLPLDDPGMYRREKINEFSTLS